MKNKISLKIIAIVLAITAALGVSVAAAYDSSEDPLITWSYLNEVFLPEIMSDIDDKFKDIEYMIENLEIPEDRDDYEEETDPVETTPPAALEVPAQFVVVELSAGDALYAVSACDIMLRAGSAYCIAPDERQGISDYTDGVEIYNGMALTKNHMCLIPRGDGRGIMANSESVFIMVRGDYTIVYR